MFKEENNGAMKRPVFKPSETLFLNIAYLGEL